MLPVGLRTCKEKCGNPGGGEPHPSDADEEDDKDDHKSKKDKKEKRKEKKSDKSPKRLHLPHPPTHQMMMTLTAPALSQADLRASSARS